MQPISWWQALILGLTQGLTEFIPVSSSAHLNIVHRVFNHPRELTFDLLLHVGTLGALIYYFRHDWKAMIFDRKQAHLRNLVLIGCVPAGVLGVLLRDAEEHPPLSEPWFNAVMLIVAGLILYAADRLSRKERLLASVQMPDALAVGLAQALALIPGVSRSGATITAGLMRGFTREDAARFSFLMSLPITAGAIGFEFYSKVYKSGEGLAAFSATPPVMAIGLLASAISGFWAIGFLLNFLARRDVLPFVIWRVFVAILVLALLR